MTEGFLSGTILFYSRLTFHGSITNSIYELFTWRRPEIYLKDSGTVSPSDSQSNWLNITKANWTHILFSTVISQSICIGISVPQLLIYISSQPSKWVVPIGFAPSMRQRSTQHFISWNSLSARRPQAPESDFFFTPCRLHLHQTRESITTAIISNARKRQWPKCASCKTFQHRMGEGGLVNYNRNLCKPQQSRVGDTAASLVYSQDGSLRKTRKARYLLFQSINFYL